MFGVREEAAGSKAIGDVLEHTAFLEASRDARVAMSELMHSSEVDRDDTSDRNRTAPPLRASSFSLRKRADAACRRPPG
jgi:hypothetical protein